MERQLNWNHNLSLLAETRRQLLSSLLLWSLLLLLLLALLLALQLALQLLLLELLIHLLLGMISLLLVLFQFELFVLNLPTLSLKL